MIAGSAPTGTASMPARLSRRTVWRGLGSVALLSGPLADAAAANRSAPTFRSGPYQFAELRPERMVPVLRLYGLDGRRFEIASPPRGPMVVNFWATWCAACRTELPLLEAIYPSLHARGFQVLAISKDRGDAATITRYLTRLGIKKLPIYRDPDDAVAYSDRANPNKAPFALYGMPITYLVRRSGIVAGYMPGAADWTASDGAALLDYLDRS